MKKKDTTSEGMSEWSSTPTGRITPADVQQKEFRVARFGAGYRVREVDEFLDLVTDALSALTEENERLLQEAGGRAPTSSPPSIRPRIGDSDSAAVDAFLRREKGFLQDLGGLVQAHAEELRTMIRAVRRDTAPSATEAPSAPAEEPRAEPAPTPIAVAEAPIIVSSPEVTREAMKDGAPAEEASTEAIEATQQHAEDPAEDLGEVTGEQTATVTGGAADEPIRLEEPEPARSRRSDEDEGGSLRELFWGEE